MPASSASPSHAPDAPWASTPQTSPGGEKRRILIVGGGFAGADLARALKRRLPAGWEVVLFSKENHFVFTPLLAEVVGAAIQPLHVVWAVREMVRGVACRTVPIRGLDLERNEVLYDAPDGQEVREHWDHLVIACGLAANLEMLPGLAEHAWPLKTLGDALALRNHVIQQLERAEAEPDAKERARLLSFAVVGGGFTGVEVAGSVMDLLIEACRYYQRFDRGDLKLTIIDGGPRVLGPLPEALSAHAERALRSRGIDLRLASKVQSVSAAGVTLGDDSLVPAATTITAVGNTMQPLLANTPLPSERARLVVSPEMRVEGRDDVWAVGDCAAVPNAFDGSISPTLGQFAMRQAEQLAKNLLAVIAGREPQPFSYHTRGMFAAIGHGRAVGNPFGAKLTGLLAYVMWRAIYWSKMPGFARRIEIALDWTGDLLWAKNIVEIPTLRTRRGTQDERDDAP